MKLLGFEVTSRVKYEFHVSKHARNKYDFNASLFSVTGDLLVANFYQARILAEKINSKRKDEPGSRLVTAGQINALGLLHEIFHFILRYYEEKENPQVFSRGINHLTNRLGKEDIDKVLLEFTSEFPPMDVYNGRILPEEYVNGTTSGKPNREILLEELLLLNLENDNPAVSSLEELYSDKPLVHKTKYADFISEAENFFVTEKPFGKENLPLTQFLRRPIKTNPYSIEGQLDYIINTWGVFIYHAFYDRLLGGKDLLHEDYKLFVPHGGGEKATPPVPKYEFDAAFFERLKAKIAAGEALTADEAQFYYSEHEQFTEDIDWMPRVVMIAKNTYVWLDQLSKKYQREIKRLEQVPDEELDNLARWNFTALWLIGIWERSSASKKIKHLTGNPEAVSSAYSLYDYIIAAEIGGEDAFQNLKHRCWLRGIRLSSDMVPNHTGIYSKWVVEKPHYFIQSPYPPYPGYTFHGPNLSDDGRVEVRIEDKYYNKTDAAVVFQRRDSYTGDVTYIYHGNDGTHMPWNDTAQLNLLIPEVRESLIQTIMHVARKTPVIRFDAAMTLAKKHYQRLWFPQPGTGGAVPSRSDHAMSRASFDEAMPVEFWREVVDRINAEMPQTLLLAEAFWLMESYFVRTLGMHRVYNSAFMHMMMKEENQKYRELLKNTLEFNPEILKRYVNFMSNPDEETAVNQFGKGDKYFGICIMLITMPGLPMFAHGQIEGFTEKYGMEYKCAYYNEFVDEYLVRRHEAEVFPLLQKRYLFSQVYNFELYDFIKNDGNVNENVYAFSNKHADERVVVVYNNSYEETAGTINFSLQKANTAGGLYNNKLADAAAIKNDSLFYYICREHRSTLEYIFNGKNIHDYGLYIPLSGYEYRVYLDFREVFDHTGIYKTACENLAGNGVPSADQYLQELQLASLHNSIRKLFSPVVFDNFISYCFPAGDKDEVSENENILDRTDSFIDEFNKVNSVPVDKDIVTGIIKDELSALRKLNFIHNNNAEKKRKPSWVNDIKPLFTVADGDAGKRLIFPVLIFKNISAGRLSANPETNKNIFDNLFLDRVLKEVFEKQVNHGTDVDSAIKLIKTLSLDENIFSSEKVMLKQSFPDESPKAKKRGVAGKAEKTREKYLLERIFSLNSVFNYLQVNEYEGKQYYHKESFEDLINWIFTIGSVKEINKIVHNKAAVKNTGDRKNISGAEDTEKKFVTAIKKEIVFFSRIKELSQNSGFVISNLLELAGKEKKKTIIKAEDNGNRKTGTKKRSTAKKQPPPSKKTGTKKKTS
jgi:glycosidase